MASLHRQEGKPFWFCSYSIFDPQTGRWRRVFRSTKTRSKKQAHEVMRTLDKAAREAHKGILTADTARALITEGVNEVLRVTKGEVMPSKSVKAWCATWLESKEKETSESTCERYKCITDRFIAALGDTKSNRDLSTLQADDIARFRDREAEQLAISTANLSLRVLRSCFADAVEQGLLTLNPALRVKKLKWSGESRRRAFTVPEIQRILKACGDDQEWRGLVLFGLYLGQRLGDLRKLTWRALDLETGEVAFTTRKTGRRIVLPLMQPLTDYLGELPASDNPNAHIFPNAAKEKHIATLSNQFRDLLTEAGLAEPRKYSRANANQPRAREMSELSFHSLRHSAVTLLKSVGTSDFIVRDIVGHESAAVSPQYTHLSSQDKRRAMEKLPDVSAPTKAKRTKK